MQPPVGDLSTLGSMSFVLVIDLKIVIWYWKQHKFANKGLAWVLRSNYSPIWPSKTGRKSMHKFERKTKQKKTN